MGECKKCSDCCCHIAAEIDPPDNIEQYKNFLDYLKLDDVKIYLDDEESWCILIEHKCTWLGSDGLCTDYLNRPTICREYSSENCTHTIDQSKDDEIVEEFEALFNTSEEFKIWYRVTYPNRVKQWNLNNLPDKPSKGYAYVDVNSPDEKSSYDEICWFLLHRDVKIFRSKQKVWNVLAEEGVEFANTQEGKENIDVIFSKREEFVDWMKNNG